jgi:hypothetical protein
VVLSVSLLVEVREKRKVGFVGESSYGHREAKRGLKVERREEKLSSSSTLLLSVSFSLSFHTFCETFSRDSTTRLNVTHSLC